MEMEEGLQVERGGGGKRGEGGGGAFYVATKP